MTRGRMALGLVMALVVTGCQGPAARPVASPEKARQSLTAALEGWRQGKKELTHEGQPITLRDEAFATGGKLLSFQFGTDQAYGYDQQFRVTLTVRDKQGRTRTEQATYNVRTEPAVVIVRLEDE